MSIIDVLKDMFTSKKHLAALLAILVVALNRRLGLGLTEADVTKIVGLAMSLIVGQGVADFGKGRQQAQQRAEEQARKAAAEKDRLREEARSELSESVMADMRREVEEKLRKEFELKVKKKEPSSSQVTAAK